MHTLDIPSAKIHIKFPSELNELKPDQFTYLVEQFLLLLNNQISLHDFKVLIASKFLKLKKNARFYALKEEAKEEIYDNISAIAEEMDSFLTYENECVSLKTNCTVNLLPRIGKLLGPDDVLSDCTAFEYKEAHSAFTQFVNTQNGEYLDRLIAILYRPRKKFLFFKMMKNDFNGQYRQEFTPKTNPLLLEKRIKKVAKLPYHIKFAVFLIYLGFEEFIRTGEIEVDGNQISLADLYSNDSSESTDEKSIGLIGLFYELAESRVFGNIDEVMNTNIYDIFCRIYQLVKMSDKLKKQLENDKSKQA